jgi:hypothetical protein
MGQPSDAFDTTAVVPDVPESEDQNRVAQVAPTVELLPSMPLERIAVALERLVVQYDESQRISKAAAYVAILVSRKGVEASLGQLTSDEEGESLLKALKEMEELYKG